MFERPSLTGIILAFLVLFTILGIVAQSLGYFEKFRDAFSGNIDLAKSFSEGWLVGVQEVSNGEIQNGVNLGLDGKIVDSCNDIARRLYRIRAEPGAIDIDLKENEPRTWLVGTCRDVGESTIHERPLFDSCLKYGMEEDSFLMDFLPVLRQRRPDAGTWIGLRSEGVHLLKPDVPNRICSFWLVVRSRGPVKVLSIEEQEVRIKGNNAVSHFVWDALAIIFLFVLALIAASFRRLNKALRVFVQVWLK